VVSKKAGVPNRGNEPETAAGGKKQQNEEPIEYTPAFCEKMLAFFKIPRQRIVYDIERFQNGELKRKKPVLFAPEYPTLDRFARSIGLTLPVLYQWEKQYPEFAEACAAARQIQKDCIIVNALNRNFDAGFSKFLLCARFPEEFSEKQEHPDSTGLDIHILYGKDDGQDD